MKAKTYVREPNLKIRVPQGIAAMIRTTTIVMVVIILIIIVIIIVVIVFFFLLLLIILLFCASLHSEVRYFKYWRFVATCGPRMNFTTFRTSQRSFQRWSENHFKDALAASIRKRGGVQKSMGNKVPWKIGVLIYLPVTSQPPHFLAERSSFITL